MVLKLYTHALSTCGRRVAVILQEKKVPYELIQPDWAAKEHKSGAWTKNQPFGQMPYIDVSISSLYYFLPPLFLNQTTASFILPTLRADEGNGSESEGGAPSDRHHHSNTKKEEKKPQSAGRGKKRNIQMQESYKEFRVETQDDLISRHRKVVSADRFHEVEVSPRAGPSRSRRQHERKDK